MGGMGFPGMGGMGMGGMGFPGMGMGGTGFPGMGMGSMGNSAYNGWPSDTWNNGNGYGNGMNSGYQQAGYSPNNGNYGNNPLAEANMQDQERELRHERWQAEHGNTGWGNGSGGTTIGNGGTGTTIGSSGTGTTAGSSGTGTLGAPSIAHNSSLGHGGLSNWGHLVSSAGNPGGTTAGTIRGFSRRGR
jgi:hypothetical protein